MDEPPLNYSSAEALTPFSDIEARRLRRYVQHADELRSSRFFEQGRREATIQVSVDGGMDLDFPRGEDEELVTVMVARLRKLHAPGRAHAASFPRVIEMLHSHVRPEIDNAHAQWFREVLESHQDRVKHAASTSLIGLVREHVDSEGNLVQSESAGPNQIFNDWLYGIYLHDDEEKLARVEAWKQIPIHRFNFLEMATDLARRYYGFSGIVREVLAEPALVPVSTSASAS